MNNTFIFEIKALPDFSDLCFLYLGEKVEQRKAEILKKQIQMIRMFHDLGENWGISVRFRKREKQIRLYFVFCCHGAAFTREQRSQYQKQISNMFVGEYEVKAVKEEDYPEIINLVWANYSSEIYKQEEIYEGNIQDYYSCTLWNGMSNDMHMLCSNMLQSDSDTEVSITVKPTTFHLEEKQWVNNCMQQMKEVQMGERLKNEEGHVVMDYEPIPIFSGPADNYSQLIKRYGSNKIFQTSLTIFTETSPQNMISAFLNGAVKNNASYRCFGRRERGYELHMQCHENVDISYGICSDLWMKNELPLRAQRLNRLCDVEEISNFMRIPIPVDNHFPGFLYDAGMGAVKEKKKAALSLNLGKYLDDASGSEVEVEMDAKQLAKHGLIVGVPGSGKTTAMFNILHQLWEAPEEERIPFIVMEPAKTEFRALKTIPHFKDSMLVFTLGDDGVSPFRFNPFEVLPGIPLERHISRLNACFIGAFDLFDPLPILLDQAIRRTYREKGWYEDSVGGEFGVETPTLTDLCRNAEYIVNHSGFDPKMASDFKASLLQRLNSLRRGSKGRMLDTRHSIPLKELMEKPIILELDALNEDEKSLMMMLILSFVYEYCKVERKSGSPLKHMLLVEEAHNLIGASNKSEGRANPKEQTIQLFVNMLAEMRALGEGILIADQLPTAIASQAVKQTNVKILMRVTAKDDRQEIGNTMDLSEKEMKNVVHFKTGHAYLFHEGLDRVRMMRMVNYKDTYGVEEPPTDHELQKMMADYVGSHQEIYLPYKDCPSVCTSCKSRIRSQAEQFASQFFTEKGEGSYYKLSAGDRAFEGMGEAGKKLFSKCTYCYLGILEEKDRIAHRYGMVGKEFPQCAFIHLHEKHSEEFAHCKDCECGETKKQEFLKSLESEE